MASDLHELDRRSANGIDVALFWRKHDNRVVVAVADVTCGRGFALVVREGERALDVFNHPYAYAALRGIDTDSPVPPELPWAA